MTPKDPPVSVPSAWIIVRHYTYLSYVGARGSNSDPYAYTAVSLPTNQAVSLVPSDALYWQTRGMWCELLGAVPPRVYPPASLWLSEGKRSSVRLKRRI